VPCLALVFPALAADNILNPDKPAEDPKVRAKLLQAEFLQGKLTAVEGDEEKTFVLEVTQKVKAVNAKQAERYQDLMKKYNDLSAKRKFQEAQKLAPDIQDALSKYYEMVDVPYEFALKGDKDLVVRRTKLPPKEGEDGKPGKYTPEELKTLKGDDPKLPGYMAEPKDLDKDLIVKVYLDRSKIKAAPAPKAKKEEPEEAVMYPVKMMVILPPAESPLFGGGNNPKEPQVKEDPKYRAKLLEGQYLEGKIVDGNPEEGLVLEVTQKVRTVNQAEATRYQQLLQDRAKARDVNALKQVDDRIKDCMAKYYDVKEVPYRFAIEGNKDTKIRQLKLPPKEPGDDGKPGKYTPEELKTLKGDDPKLPGYTADAKDLGPDTVIRVYLDKSKIKPMPKPKPGEEPTEDVISYPMTMIVIVPPPEPAAGFGIGAAGGLGK